MINTTSRVNHLLEEQPPHSRLTGQLTDISSIIEFGWYDWVIYRVEGHKFPLQHQRLGMALGASNNSGSAMSQWVLTSTDDVMHIQTLSHLIPYERSSPVMLKRMKEFDKHTKKNYGDSMSIPTQQYSSNNIYPEHDDKTYKSELGVMENIYVPY